jgi:hypothetical protein
MPVQTQIYTPGSHANLFQQEVQKQPGAETLSTGAQGRQAASAEFSSGLNEIADDASGPFVRTGMLNLDIDLAYIAGLIDGEGTITLCRTQRNGFRYPVLSATNCSRTLLEFLKSKCGGHISHARLKIAKKHSPAWKWELRSDGALKMIARLLPFLKEPVKIRRAEFLLCKYKAVTVRNGRYRLSDRALKVKFEKEFFLITASGKANTRVNSTRLPRPDGASMPPAPPNCGADRNRRIGKHVASRRLGMPLNSPKPKMLLKRAQR